jgi:hypothetical protein
MESPESDFLPLTAISSTCQGGMLAEVTTKTGGVTPGCVNLMVARALMLKQPDALVVRKMEGSVERRTKGGGVVRISVGEGISSVVEGAFCLLLPGHSAQIFLREGRFLRMLMAERRKQKGSRERNDREAEQEGTYPKSTFVEGRQERRASQRPWGKARCCRVLMLFWAGERESA